MSSFHKRCRHLRGGQVTMILCGCLWLAFSGAANGASDGLTGYYGVGTRATEFEIAGWDIDVRPDGQGLPAGQGSVEDGEMLYEDQCAECHGSFGEGVGRFPVLAGGEGSLTDSRPGKTVGSFWAHTSTLWDYIRRTMPFAKPESLADNEVYALTAYVLYLNDLVAEDFVLSRDNFTEIELPNRAGFVPDPRPDVFNIRCMENCKNSYDVKIVSFVSLAPVASSVLSAAESQTGVAGTHAGGAVYLKACALCHESGIGGAPVHGDASSWRGRLAEGSSMLIEHAINGYRGDAGYMPPKGGFVELSDEEVTNAVVYMIEVSR